MKKMKRFFAVLLSLAMVLGMSVTVFAAGETAVQPKIAITNLPEYTEKEITEGKKTTITYKQIAVAAPTEPIGWALADKVTLPEGVTLEMLTQMVAENPVNKNAADGKINTSVIQVGNEQYTLADIAKGINLKDTTDTAVVTGTTTAATYDIAPVSAGLYVIEVQATGYTFARMLAYVGYDTDMKVNAITSVTAKGEKDQVKKEITKVTVNGDDSDIDTSVAEGDSVAFKITANYPYLDQTLVNKKFIVTDTVDGGTINADSIVVKIGSETATKKDAQHPDVYDYELTPDTITNTFTVTFKYDVTKAGSVVEITYNVNVAAGGSLENKVESTISKYPEGNNPEGETKTESVVIVPKVSATVLKTDDNADESARVALNGAVFSLYVETDEAHAEKVVVLEGENQGTIMDKTDYKADDYAAVHQVKYLKAVTTVEGNTTKAVTATTKTVQVPDTENEGQTKSQDGIATFDNLDAQKAYWIAETQAPTGYSLNTTAKKLTGAAIKADPKVETITENGVTTVTTTYEKEHDFAQIDITDTKLNSLPSTGGIGTTIFTIGGCAVMIIAAGLFFATRRKSAK